MAQGVPRHPPQCGAGGTLARAGRGGTIFKLCGYADGHLALSLAAVVHREQVPA